MDNNITNLTNNVSYDTAMAQNPQVSNTQQITDTPLNNSQYVNTVTNLNNMEPNINTNYTNVYNQQVFDSIRSNVTLTQENLQAQAQVVQPTTQESPQVQAQVVQPTTTVIPQPATEIVINTQQTDNNTTPGNYTLKTNALIDLVNNAKKAAIYEERIFITTVMQLIFSPNGLEVRCTDGVDTFVQKDETIKFLDTCSFCVDAELFTKLVNKLDTEEVQLIYDKDQHLLNVYSNGVFKIPERYDAQTGESIIIPDDCLVIESNDTVKTVDLNMFKSLIQKSNVFAGNSNIFAQLSGIYCKDKIFSTDKVCMFSTDNVPELRDESFYMSPAFVNLLTTLNFEDQVTFAFKKDTNGVIQYIIVKDSTRVLGGPVSEYTSRYPLEALDRVTTNVYANEFKVNKNLLISILDKADLFKERNSKSQSVMFVTDSKNKTLSVQTFNKQADQVIHIDGQNIPNGSYCLGVENMLKAVKNCLDDEIVISTDPSNDVCCKITSDNIIETISYSLDQE